MISSQALMLNLFGPLIEDLDACAAVFAHVLPDLRLTGLRGVDLEWAPRKRSMYLNDMTRVDVLLRADTKTGPRTIAIELKYTDRFNSRNVPLEANSRYASLNRDRRIWIDGDDVLETRACNQLARIHALLESEARLSHQGPGTLVVLHHDQDEAAVAVCDAYSSRLRNPSTLLKSTLTDFVAAWESCASSRQQETVERLRHRYCDEHLSDSEFLRSNNVDSRVSP